MDPVIGLDIAKGESQVQAYLRKKEPFQKTFKFQHDSKGLMHFEKFIYEMKQASGVQPQVLFESTGHYHEPIIQFLEERGVPYYLVNPIVSFETKKTSLRKVKTDPIDAAHLCDLYYKEELETHKRNSVKRMNLRNLTRQHHGLTNSFVQLKLKFQAILEQVFPEYQKVFTDLYCKSSLHTFLRYPTSNEVLSQEVEDIADYINGLGGNRSYSWSLEKAYKLKEAALQNPFKQNLYQSHLITAEVYIKMILEYQRHLSTLEKKISALAKEFDEYEIIKSIPGIGDKIAPTIISEIGEIDQFHHPKKLVAFAGLDPSVHQSGKFKARKSSITKRGSTHLRRALYTAVGCSLKGNRNPRLRAFYDKKKEEGKIHQVAVVACARKLVTWIYALLKRKEAFKI